MWHKVHILLSESSSSINSVAVISKLQLEYADNYCSVVPPNRTHKINTVVPFLEPNSVGQRLYHLQLQLILSYTYNKVACLKTGWIISIFLQLEIKWSSKKLSPVQLFLSKDATNPLMMVEITATCFLDVHCSDLEFHVCCYMYTNDLMHAGSPFT